MTYDAQSLLSSRENLETEQNDGVSSKELGQRKKSNASKQMLVYSNLFSPNEQISVNEEFNQKLIQYGSEQGVPENELPSPNVKNAGRNMKTTMA